MNNDDSTLDDEDGGIIMNDGPIECYEFSIPITVGHFRMDGRHGVFGFYIHIARPFKQVSNKLGIIFFLCAKALDGTNYYQWTWVKCERVVTNKNTNMIFHLESNHSGLSSFKTPVSNRKKKGSVSSGPSTLHSIG